MKLGPRIAIVTTLLTAGVFGVTATAVLHIQRLDLERDLDRQARAVAQALAAGLEPLALATAREVLGTPGGLGRTAGRLLQARDPSGGGRAHR